MADKILTRSEKSYQGPFIYDADGDLSKEWFIWYKFLHPTKKTPTGKSYYQRFKVFGGDRLGYLSKAKTLAERRELAHTIKLFTEELLASGYNPFQKDKQASFNNNIVTRIEQYIEYVDNSQLAGSTKKEYKQVVNFFKKWIEDNNLQGLELSEIKRDHIREFMNVVQADPKKTSKKTHKHFLSDISTFFNYFINNYEGAADKNPAKTISLGKITVKGNESYTDREMEAIKAKCLEKDPYIWFICQVVYYAALRINTEGLSLKISWINFKNDTIVIPGDKAKGRKNQVIPMYPELKKLLLENKIDKAEPDHYLFTHSGKPGEDKLNKDSLSRRFVKIKEAANIKGNRGIYAFKHTRACHLFDDGASIRDIQILCRHEDPYATLAYLRTLGRVEKQKEYNKGREI